MDVHYHLLALGFPAWGIGWAKLTTATTAKGCVEIYARRNIYGLNLALVQSHSSGTIWSIAHLSH